MNTITTTKAQGLRQAWDRLAAELFDREGMDVLFTYARNLLTGTVIIAAGLHAANHKGPIPLPGMWWSLRYAGYVVALVGVVMLGLNLTDGLRRLARRQHPLALRLLAGLVYITISMRLTQVIVLFRYGF
jgi:hypothetical protein